MLISLIGLTFIDFRQSVQRKQIELAIEHFNPSWQEWVKSSKIPDIPKKSTSLDGDFIKIRLANDEIYYIPFSENKDKERVLSLRFYKSKNCN